jgi:acetyl esterase/lipase
MTGVSTFIAEQGWVAVNINYRLLPDHPFPAALEDVLAAYRWIKNTDQEDISRQDRTRVTLLGASAGAFLAMMAGLILGRGKVQSIVSISGPSQRRRASDSAASDLDPRLLSAPVELVNPESPPLLAIHSRNDELVKPEESIAIVKRMQEAECQAELYLYDGPGKQHGIWRDDRTPLRFFQHIEDVIAKFIRITAKT